jgi:hypothetical protein
VLQTLVSVQHTDDAELLAVTENVTEQKREIWCCSAVDTTATSRIARSSGLATGNTVGHTLVDARAAQRASRATRWPSVPNTHASLSAANPRDSGTRTGARITSAVTPVVATLPT